MTTALQRLTKHTSATHSMHKSTRLATLALHNSPTNVSIVANTVAVGLGPHNAHQPLLTNATSTKMHKRRMVTFSPPGRRASLAAQHTGTDKYAHPGTNTDTRAASAIHIRL